MVPFPGEFISMKYTTSESRVVIITGVDEGTGLGQVLDIAHAPRRVISITTMATGTILEPGKISVMLEYVNARYASDFVAIQAKHPMVLQDKTSHDYSVDVKLVTTKSSEISKINRDILLNQGTRSLALDLFPRSACWYILKAIGMKFIVRAEFESMQFGNASFGRFNIEFTSLFEANKSRRMLFSNRHDIYKPKSMDIKFTDWCISEETQLTKRHLGSASHVPKTLLVDRFYTWPYHTYVPGPPAQDKKKDGLDHPSVDLTKVKIGPIEISYEEFSEAEDSSDDEKQVRRQLPELTYRIIGSNCQLTLRQDGFSVPVSDDFKITSAVAMGAAELKAMFDSHFNTSDEFDYRKYDEYAVVVQHRLRVVAETGVPYHLARCHCGGSGCNGIRDCPIGEITNEWSARILARNALEAAARERKRNYSFDN